MVAISTDLPGFVGAALGLNLLFGVPLFPAGLLTAAVAFAVLALEQRGYRKFELAVIALLGLVALGFVWDFLAVGNQSASGIAGGLVPGFEGSESVVLAIGIIGATVMPHVVYLHSALTRGRIRPADDAERRQLLRFTKLDCGLGLGSAGLINLSMLFIAVALLASGLSSSSVGTYAGQIVVQGFIRRRIPLFARRAVTMLPALVVLALGLPTTQVLVLSQVVLSFGIPFALVPLILVTRDRSLTGALVNRRATTAVAAAIAIVIIALNAYLLVTTFAG